MTALQNGLYLQALGCPVEVKAERCWVLVMAWDTGRLHRLLAGHPERELRLPDWATPDWEVVTGQTALVIPITPPRRPRAARSHQAGSDGPTLADSLRAAHGAGLRPLPRSGGCWRAMCPLCQLRGRWDRRLSIRYMPGGRVLVHCFGGCDWRDLQAVLELGEGEA